ncbi:MAG: leucyl aminopeptidase [candidate division Zixibacteria bacterium]|nr:leucyl aminopeptidase [candidate division Zixibacteria bacterium]
MAPFRINATKQSFVNFKGDCLIIPLYSDAKTLPDRLRELDERHNNIISGSLRSDEFSANPSQTFVLNLPPDSPLRKIILCGIGSSKDLKSEGLRKSIASAARQSEKLGGKIGIALPVSDNLKPEVIAGIALEGFILAVYKFERYKSNNKGSKKSQLKAITILSPDAGNLKSIDSSLRKAEAICDAVWFGRDIINSPANAFNTQSFVTEARKLSKRAKVKAEIIGKEELKKLGMNAILGVAQGSAQPPKLIALEYKGGKAGKAPLVLVGKGVVFDSGGLSLKQPLKMLEMKQDMGGAGVILSAFRAIIELGIKINMVALIPTVENMPSGTAYRPGDIIKTHSGITVEVLNTDAEGRLILADALSYARKYKPQAVIDVATLTGGIKIALGRVGCGVFSPDDSLAEIILGASENTGEKAWRFPLWDEFDRMIESNMADIKNSAGPEGSSITAAKFLGRFTTDYKWAHIDIANVDYASSDEELFRKGATGFGIRLLINLIENWKQ